MHHNDKTEIGPWTILRRVPKYATPWIDVVHHDVIDPGGKSGVYGTVHFKNLAIGILPLDTDGYTWLVGQHRFPLDAYSWEIPEGGGPLNIDPLESAKRELREETGLLAARWDQLLELHMSNSVSDERAVAYLARDLTIGPSEPDSTEELALKRLPFEDVYQMVLNGSITDALAVATILRTKLLISGQ